MALRQVANVIDRSSMQRKKVPPLPFEMVREAVANALIHRDYNIRQSFNATMLSRNPELHYVFARMEMAEERGLGIKTWKNLAEQLQLPLPKYSFEDPYLVLTLFRSPESAMLAMTEDVVEKLNADERLA